MNSMMAAIKSKRGASGDVKGVEVEMGAKNALSSLVDSLDESQKMELMQILSKKMGEHEGEEGNPEKVREGEATPNEQKIIAQKSEENSGDMSSEESDNIAASMINRRDEQMAEAGMKPRNLGERARMAMANKLKAKGKI